MPLRHRREKTTSQVGLRDGLDRAGTFPLGREADTLAGVERDQPAPNGRGQAGWLPAVSGLMTSVTDQSRDMGDTSG